MKIANVKGRVELASDKLAEARAQLKSLKRCLARDMLHNQDVQEARVYAARASVLAKAGLKSLGLPPKSAASLEMTLRSIARKRPLEPLSLAELQGLARLCG